MRTVLTLICCFGLALFAGAAQQQQQQNNSSPSPKKKGGGNVASQQQVMTPHTGKGFKKTGQGGNVQNFQQSTTTHNNKMQKFQGTGQGNLSPANKTKFNKSNVVNKNINKNVNKNFKVQKFNLQTNKVVTKYKTVNFNKNYKIAGAYKWGPQYSVFINYQPQWQPTWWWNWHYGNHIVFIYGGWYYWDNLYWYPAWGYAPNSSYYYDGPIYASNPDYDPAQVVANVQSALQQQGYYQGDIDGILGPQTRAALAEYQSAQGLEPTGLVDQPTLETLGMA